VRDYYELESKVEWWAWAWAITKLWPEWVPVQLREMVYAITGGAWRKYMKEKTENIFVDKLGFSPKLASIFSYMYGNHGSTPKHSPFAFHAVNLQHFSNGSYYPVGGPAQFANTIIPIIEEAGGQLAVQTPVRRILVEGNKAVGVEVNSGEQIRAPVVISACGAHTTYMELLPRHVAERHGYPEKFEQIKPSVAHVYMFLGYDEHIELPKEIIWQIPGYNIEEIDRKYKDEMDLEIMGAYLLCPSARDPVFAQRYPNKSTVIALAEAPYAWVEKCKKDPEFKKSFEERLGKNLERIILNRIPQLQGKTPTYRKAGVPIGCNPYAWQASSLGLEPSGERFTDHTHWLRPKTKIDNLYLTGQDSFSAGFCGSMFSGRLTYAAMTGNYAFLLRKSIGVFP